MKFSINKVKEGLGQVQDTLHWGLRIVKAPNALSSVFSEDLEIRVTSSGIPVAEETELQVELQGHRINYAGKVVKGGEISLTFVEGTDAAVVSYFSDWRKAKWSDSGSDTEGKQSLTADLKADLKLRLYNVDDVVTQEYTIVGAMPKLTAVGDLGQTAEALSPQVTFVYDDFFLVVLRF